MNFLADESVDRQVVDRLRRDGHRVLYVAEIAPSTPDDAVLQQANVIQAVLITADKDFGALVYRQGRIHAGVVLIRLAGVPPETKGVIVSAAIQNHGDELADAFSVVTRGTVRIRHQV